MHASDSLLTDQVAVITGGGGGIGRAIALAYASAGADIAIGDIVPERCEETTARVREMGRKALAIPTDVMHTDQVRALIERTSSEFGRIDVLVNNAGGVSARPFLEQSERSWRRHIDLNLVSMLAATSAAVPVMIRGGCGGSIVNIASIEATRAAPEVRRLRRLQGGHGQLHPDDGPGARGISDSRERDRARRHRDARTSRQFHGPVDPSTWTLPSAEQEDAFARYIPLGREGADTDCGNAAVFLASRMSAYVTGAVLPVDGGTWASSGWVRSRAGKWTLVERRTRGRSALREC